MSDCPQIITCTVRGNTVFVTAQFFDQYGEPAEPSSVMASFDYAQNGARATQDFPMIFNSFSGMWNYNWDSSGIDPCEVFWSVFTDPSVQPIYAAEGSFTVAANNANLNAL
jgi:hypothetical protein